VCLCTVCCSPEVYRINLEQGRFLSPLTTGGREVKCCEFNDLHQLLACGTSEVRGHVEPLLTVYRVILISEIYPRLNAPGGVTFFTSD